MPKFPNVKVDLIGYDGNAFVILGRVQKAMRLEKVPKEDIDSFMKEAMSGDYDHLLQTVTKYVVVQ
jgi:hypothetical protein